VADGSINLRPIAPDCAGYFRSCFLLKFYLGLPLDIYGQP